MKIKTNGHVNNPKEMLKLNKLMKQAYNNRQQQEKVEQPTQTTEKPKEDKQMSEEKVNHPPHYNKGKIEVIDAIEAWDLNFNCGNVVKYVVRHKHKGTPIEDIEKAVWYLSRYLVQLKEEARHANSSS